MGTRPATRCAPGGGVVKHVSKLPKLLHISSKLGEIFATYGGGSIIIKHNITHSKERHFLVPIMGKTPFPWLGMGSTRAHFSSLTHVVHH
jgi:hypothetical protein